MAGNDTIEESRRKWLQEWSDAHAAMAFWQAVGDREKACEALQYIQALEGS